MLNMTEFNLPREITSVSPLPQFPENEFRETGPTAQSPRKESFDAIFGELTREKLSRPNSGGTAKTKDRKKEEPKTNEPLNADGSNAVAVAQQKPPDRHPGSDAPADKNSDRKAEKKEETISSAVNAVSDGTREAGDRPAQNDKIGDLLRNDLAISYMTNGQKVPEDLMLPSATDLARYVLPTETRR